MKYSSILLLWNSPGWGGRLAGWLEVVGKSENPVVSLDLDLDFGLRLRVRQFRVTFEQNIQVCWSLIPFYFLCFQSAWSFPILTTSTYIPILTSLSLFMQSERLPWSINRKFLKLIKCIYKLRYCLEDRRDIKKGWFWHFLTKTKQALEAISFGYSSYYFPNSSYRISFQVYCFVVLLRIFGTPCP